MRTCVGGGSKTDTRAYRERDAAIIFQISAYMLNGWPLSVLTNWPLYPLNRQESLPSNKTNKIFESRTYYAQYRKLLA